MPDNKTYLINLPSPWMVNEFVYPPLGLMYLYEYLLMNGVDVSIIDLAGQKESEWDIPQDGKFYGISSTTPQYPFAVKVAEKIKTGIKIIGGVHATALNYQCADESGLPDKDYRYKPTFDFVVIGEGENTLLDILKNKLLKGVFYKTSGTAPPIW